jgi:hypothetical protein
MSLRKQFEAFAMEKLIVSRGDLLQTDSGKRYRCVDIEQAWEIFQAGHAASGRDELTEALRKIELAFYDSPAHGKLACEMVGIATEAIKKARGET